MIFSYQHFDIEQVTIFRWDWRVNGLRIDTLE